MTELELEYPRAEAIELVAAAFENMRSLSSYEVDAENGTIVGQMSGGVTSFGEEVRVTVSEGRGGSPTIVTVTAARRVSYNRNSNPWKYKSEFVRELNELRGRSVAELRPRSAASTSSSEDDSSAPGPAEDEPVNATAEAINRGTRIILYLFLGALGLMVLVSVLAIMF